MKNQVCIFLAILILFMLPGCSNDKEASVQKEKKDAVELSIAAAASLKEAVGELQDAFKKEYPQVTITVNFGSSGQLAQQIQQGVPVDIFLSADQKWMNMLEDENLIVKETRKDFTGNKIVLIGEKDSDKDFLTFENLKGDEMGQIAIGDPDSVPAGTYTKEVLENLGKWEELKNKFVYGSDVTQVLTYVESGNTDIGFVYSSDALISEKVQVLAEADSSLHTPIIYPAAVLTDSTTQDTANKFIEFLLSEQAQTILAEYGFIK
ncbi:molybdate ABC transporter substrate-binding protein [Niallia sp. Sow4_A1]|uniref:Molybdate ABC transporter substrate-binding protein n=1 Tax=Niallia hominis TaxID=3133173 RepID=A0ABV1F1J8_9BACI|nr:molybdate ABC transporter substrate-binding protein [Niallia circulans]MCF2647507.1 molybdate ABC transporter substrate-binding protein [Niallia circulans]